VPTMVGWIAGSATCLITMAVLHRALPNLGDVTLTATIAGLFIIAPTYLLFVLPYSLLCRRHFRERNHVLPWWPLCVLLFAFGGAVTFVLLFRAYGEHVTLASRTPAENPALFLLPFIPYSLIVAWLVPRLTKWSFRYNA
jgi:hypothetical protein